MNEGQRYFGMTRMQIGILAGLAGMLCLIVIVGGWLVLSNRTRMLSNSSVPVAASTVTSVAVVSPTTESTTTPTPIPYDQLVPADWYQFKTSLVEIWMPKNFKLADKKTKDITANFGIPDLLLAEVSSKSSAYTMLVSVSYDLTTGGSLDQVLDEKFPNLPYQARIADRRTDFINTLEVRRVLIEFKVDNIDYNNLVYLIQDGNTVWYVQYVAEISEFFDNLPIFEQSIKTFRPVRY